MDSLLFNRTASLRVQSRSGLFESSEGRPVIVQRDFLGLRTQFSIEKSSESTPNQARISVYNLNADSRSFVEEAGQTLILEVGYAPLGQNPSTEIIFQGDVGKVTNQRNGPDWVTTFEVGDSQKKLSEVTFDRTYESGVSLSKAIQDVAGGLGLAVNSIKGLKDSTFRSGVTLSGGSKEILDGLTKDAGVEWSVQDGEVNILGPQQASDDEVIIVSPESGLINSPIKREQGLEFTSLLLPKIRPGRRVEIRSRAVNGLYRVRKVNFDGDTLEGDWTSKCECVEVRA